MTEKLYYENSYIQRFEAEVLACEKQEDYYEIVLDKTAFFPEGGGQSADRGFLNGIPLSDAREKNGIVYHITSQPIHPGTSVLGEIDFKERFSKMQQHTGEHIISGIVHRRFGWHNVGFHLGSEIVTMDFDGALNADELADIEYQANEIAFSNRKVEISYPAKEDLEKLEYRSKIEIEGQVRIVTIPGVDVCACCAPHVNYTGEIGMIKIVDAQKYKGGTRVSMLCGFRALHDYRTKERNINQISVVLSAKPDLSAEAVLRQKEELQHDKDRMIYFQGKYIEEKAGRIPDGGDGHIGMLLFEEDLDSGMMRKYVNLSVGKTDGISGCFVGDDQNGYRYVLGSETLDVRSISGEMNRDLDGKGGGKPGMVQGSVNGTKEQILNVMKRVLADSKTERK
ncbi:MAG: alanyl-tRNA editing protein [Clostridiales bacterium]|nr:alanyl-tRNA editing protein [Clostridiales bacterium]MDU3241726.1 alanyl-tRNA editing protein [Clostridiales bacterium]